MGAKDKAVKGALEMFWDAIGRIRNLKDPTRPVLAENVARGEELVRRGQAPLWTASEVTYLPLDKASIDQRNFLRGRTETGFHGTPVSPEFDEFFPGTHAGTAKAANDRVGSPDNFMGMDEDIFQPSVMRLVIPKPGKTVIHDLDPYGYLTNKEWLEEAAQHGADMSRPIPYVNVREDVGSTSVAIPKSDMIRSSSAPADPANEGTGYLLGSHPVAGTVAGALALYQMLKSKLSMPSQ